MQKDEIKEIITEMQLRNGRYIICKNEDISFSDEDYKAHLLLDYITNLQDRIDKAIEKLKYYSGGEADYYVPFEVIINLLQGKSEE